MPDRGGSSSAALAEELTASDFESIRLLAYRTFGLDLKTGKEQLVAARLGKRIREGNFRSYREYFDFVLADKTGEQLVGLIDALTTNYTSFLREKAHFDFLRTIAVPILRERSSLDIWSAACSTGEEPYSIAFTLFDTLPGPPYPVRILATDISTRALQTAHAGVYPAARFEGFPAEYLRRYFLRGLGRWEEHYRVKPDVRSVIAYRRLNLVEPISHSQRFSVIFCRNVMIYFDKPTQEAVVGKLASWLEPGGYLFVGHAETLAGITHQLRYVQPAVYRKAASEGSVWRDRT